MKFMQTKNFDFFVRAIHRAMPLSLRSDSLASTGAAYAALYGRFACHGGILVILAGVQVGCALRLLAPGRDPRPKLRS